MLFIILAISLGVFNANAARTLNRNIEEKLRYDIGADITITAKWNTNQVSFGSEPMMGPETPSFGIETSNAPVEYIEPPFEQFTKLDGIELATKVFKKSNVEMKTISGHAYNVDLLGIIPNEFGKVSWLRNGLMPHHLNDYLNLLAESPTAFLVSSSSKDRYKIKEGDSIYLT